MEGCLRLSGEGVGTQLLRSEEDALRSAGPEEGIFSVPSAEVRDLHAALLSGNSGSHYKGGNSGVGLDSDLHWVRTRMCTLVLTHSNLGLDPLLLFFPFPPLPSLPPSFSLSSPSPPSTHTHTHTHTQSAHPTFKIKHSFYHYQPTGFIFLLIYRNHILMFSWFNLVHIFNFQVLIFLNKLGAIDD